jgi:DNA-binding beta-propeller fold protein YncE
MGVNEIWRISLEGGAPEVVARDLGVPDSVKFDAQGFIVSTQVASGQVLRIDPRTGARTVLATIAPGLDNLTFVGDRLFVSSISGQVNEILGEGRIRSVAPDGFNWPLGLAMGEDGLLFVADGPYCYHLRPGWRPAAMESEILSDGYDRLYGVAVAPGGGVVFAEAGGGRVLAIQSGEVQVLATGLDEPMGVAIGADGTVFVSESGAGRVVKLAGGRVETVLDGLGEPQGILVHEGLLYVVDAFAKELLAHDLTSGARGVIASGLPVGAPAGVTPKFLGPIGDMSGPMGPFAGIAAGPDGTLYLSGDAEGSVLALGRRG